MLPAAGAALSDGFIAYVTQGSPGEQINLLDLATGSVRALVTFPGSAKPTRVGLEGTRLSWAQESYGYSAPLPPGACVSFGQPLGPVQLLQAGVTTATVIDEPGQPVSPPTAPLCPPPP